MRLFREVEIPEQMPISEAIDWIAFGILPEADWELDENNNPIEARMQIDPILDQFGHPFGSSANHLSARYFAEFIPEMDAKAFFAAFELCLGETPEQVLASLGRWEEMKPMAVGSLNDLTSNEEWMKLYSDRVNELRDELDAAILLRKLRIPIARRESAAQAKLLTRLIGGDVNAKGVCVPLLDSETESFGPDDWPTEFQDIPPEYWRIDGIDWLNSNLSSWSSRYLGVVVSTAEILKHFPRPDVHSVSLSGSLFGSTLLVDSESPYFESAGTVQPQRGRPRRTETILENTIFAHIQALMSADKFPTKIEAQRAEISDFVRKLCNQELPRTTAQRILARWNNHNAQKDAHK